MYNAKDVARWFLFNNKELCSGDRSGNIKLNKLLYFSNLMNNVIKGENLIKENFEKWDNGPVIPSIYRDYRYHSLFENNVAEYNENCNNEIILKIVNFVYGDNSAEELVDESHKHSIWYELNKNEYLDFSKIAKKEQLMMLNLYNLYKDIDIDNIAKEKILDNTYYYYKDEFDLTEDIVSELKKMEKMEYPVFLEKIDGELVMS